MEVPSSTSLSSNIRNRAIFTVDKLSEKLAYVGQAWWVSELSVAMEKNFLVPVTSCK